MEAPNGTSRPGLRADLHVLYSEIVVRPDDRTPLFNPKPAVIFVAVDGPIADACAKGCEPIRVVRAEGAQDAMRQMLELHPVLVLLGETIATADEDAIRQHAGAIGITVACHRDIELFAIEDWMREAVRAAVRLRTIRSI